MRPIQVVIFLATAMFFIATAVKSQAPARSAQVWEYASVSANPIAESSGRNEWTSRARICYAVAEGCRNEDLSVKDQNPIHNAEGMMMAAAKLGDQGWELTAVTDADSNPNRLERVMYFRRPKN